MCPPVRSDAILGRATVPQPRPIWRWKILTSDSAATSSKCEPLEADPAAELRLFPVADPLPRRPFIKWAGGKTRLLKHLLPYVPSRFNSYHEPFLGGGAMYFAVWNQAAGAMHLSDLNSELINTWRILRDHDILRLLDEFKQQDSESFYYEQRSRQPTDALEQAARFLYLNQTSWNGLWRVNRHGEFNVPWGQRPFRGLSADDLSAYRRLLQGVQLHIEDFRQALVRPIEGDFVYLDPPYLPLSDTSKFFFYTEKRFRRPDLTELAELCRELSERSVYWILSNRDTPLVRELFSFARICTLTTRRSVAAQNQRDVEAIDSPEAIILGTPGPK